MNTLAEKYQDQGEKLNGPAITPNWRDAQEGQGFVGVYVRTSTIKGRDGDFQSHVFTLEEYDVPFVRGEDSIEPAKGDQIAASGKVLQDLPTRVKVGDRVLMTFVKMGKGQKGGKSYILDLTNLSSKMS